MKLDDVEKVHPMKQIAVMSVVQFVVLGLMGVSMYIFNPYSSSSYTFLISQSSYFEQIGNGQDSRKSIGVLTETSSATGVNFHCSTDPNFEDFEVVCYGLRVD